MSFRVDSEQAGTGVVLRLLGDVDVATAGVLREAVIDTIAAGHADIVVDLTGVTFMDSSGLGVLVGAAKRAQHAGGTLVVTGTETPGVAAAFRASGVGRVLTSVPDPDRALDGLRG